MVRRGEGPGAGKRKQSNPTAVKKKTVSIGGDTGRT